ncbi:PD-(D/E)XK motif protein [Chloroflexota bacterium]
MSITTLFKQVKDNPSGHAFTVVAISGHTNLLLGVDIAGHPSLFVQAEEGAMEPPLRTAKVSLELGHRYSLATMGESSRTEVLHALRCESADASEVDTFLVLMEAFLAKYEGQQVNKDDLTSFFRSMVRLFAVVPARDLRSERQGLWGELFVMVRVQGLAFWAPFWHSETTRRFDFSANNRRVEVKTTVGADRIHHFSHRQIYAIYDEEIVIASLMLREEDAGLSLRELIRQARDGLRGTDHYLKLERAVREAGMDLLDESGPVYDATEAERTLAWFHSTDTPHFCIPEPPGVSQTQYRVDLSTAPQIDTQDLYKWLHSWPVPLA